jgi:hypothetical protein
MVGCLWWYWNIPNSYRRCVWNYPYTNTDPYTNPHTNPHTDPYTNPHTDSNTDTDSQSKPNGKHH